METTQCPGFVRKAFLSAFRMPDGLMAARKLRASPLRIVPVVVRPALKPRPMARDGIDPAKPSAAENTLPTVRLGMDPANVAPAWNLRPVPLTSVPAV